MWHLVIVAQVSYIHLVDNERPDPKVPMDLVLSKLNADNKSTLLPMALELANIPESIKGFGHVKEKNVAVARLKWDSLLAALKTA